ncbi:caspase family protein [Brevundimonas sp. GCM10030266]|uniref:caspase family protein n=1 Tax=Brevundimonas sp. GCM10030266 TaxID=3273386 RepID=UPI00360FC881
MLRTIFAATTALTVLAAPAHSQDRPRDTPPAGSPAGRPASGPASTPPASTSPSTGPVGPRAHASPESIRLGQTINGSLREGDATLNSGEFVDSWTFSGRRGQRLDIRLSSTAFDPYVMITGPGGFSEFNDDDATVQASVNSRLLVTLPSDGDYIIAATSYEPGERGDYRLSVEDGTGVAQAQPRVHDSERAAPGGAIQIGQTISGSLSSGDETLQSGEYFDRYTFSGRRGERVEVELTSSAFDAYTIVRSPSGEQFDNDDGEDGTDSRQQLILPEDGEYEVQVTSYQPGETGSYRFTVEPGRESVRQAAAPGGRRIFAVMVGVSDYGGASSNLDFTDEDAVKLAEALEQGGSLNEASVVLTNAQATVEGVRSAFARVAAEAGPDDMFLFFFSGHGNQTEVAASGIEPDGKSETLVLRDGEISDVEMGEMFSRLNTRLSLLVIDACYSGGFARNVVDRPGVMGLFSSEEDLTSAVASKFRAGGYLSHFLREGMVGAADMDGDRLVTAGELSTYLRRQFRTEVEDVESETQDGQRNYQNLVIDRGGVQVDDVIVRLPTAP